MQIETQFLELLENYTWVAEPRRADTLDELLMEELDLIELVMDLEEDFGIDISREDMDSHFRGTVQQALDYLLKADNSSKGATS